MKLLSNEELNKLSVSARRYYFYMLREECRHYKTNQPKFGQDVIKKHYHYFRGYEIELQGEENIPSDSNALFLINHSNSHDIFTAYEFLSMLGRKGSVMVATDCLNAFSNGIFNVSYATMFDRRVPEEKENSIFELSGKMLNGCDGAIFGESTWNLHPTKVMHNIRPGVINVGSVVGVGSEIYSSMPCVPIIPTIFEYLEVDSPVKSESKLYKKCIIRFGKPVVVNYTDSLFDQANSLRDTMIQTRKDIWRDYSINRDSLAAVDPELYVNHTWIKKFGAFGFNYDSASEQKFLLFLNGENPENEYHIDENGMFVPGITEKDNKLVLKK